ncbi:MAG: ABC transporter permease [Deinococcus sp.]|nr:ABC transporter permease [Deinococcus sp.]
MAQRTLTHSVPIDLKQGLGESKSQLVIVWQQFRKHQLAMIGGAILIVLYLLTATADFIAPYGETTAFRRAPDRYLNAPPATIYFRAPDGKLTRPFVYPVTGVRNPRTFRLEYTEDRTTPYPIYFFVRGAPYKVFFGLFTSDIHLLGVERPATMFLWGTDPNGRDLFGRIWFGARVSLTVGIFAALLALFLGLLMGGIAGYYGGAVDNVIMRMVEVLFAIPGLFLLITLRTIFPVTLSPNVTYILVISILSLVGWGGLARVIRSIVLSLREMDYTQAARALGAADARIIVRHLLPGTLRYALVSLTLDIPGFILLESALSFLGLGIQEPRASWGLMLSQAQEGGLETFAARPWLLLPGLFIFLTVLAYNFLGDGLADATDPRLRH